MCNHFNTTVAVDYDVNIAIFIQKLSEWTFRNLANNHHVYDGHCWSYNTLEAYSEIFPFWSRRQLERVIDNAVNHGLVLKDNYNKSKYDRTCWYALTYKGMDYYPELLKEKYLQTLYLSISPNGEIDFTTWRNQFHGTVTPIPTNKPTKEISNDISKEPDIPKSQNKNFSLKELKSDNPHEIPDRLLEEWIAIRKDKRARITQTAWSRLNAAIYRVEKEVGIKPIDAFESMVAGCWLSLDPKYFKDDKSRKGQQSFHEANAI
jgi:hypothetical protein